MSMSVARRLCFRLCSSTARKGPIPFSQTPAKDLSVRDSLGISAQQKFARRLPYHLLLSTGLFFVIIYFGFVREEKESNQGLQKLTEKIPFLEQLVAQADNDQTDSSEIESNAKLMQSS